MRSPRWVLSSDLAAASEDGLLLDPVPCLLDGHVLTAVGVEGVYVPLGDVVDPRVQGEPAAGERRHDARVRAKMLDLDQHVYPHRRLDQLVAGHVRVGGTEDAARAIAVAEPGRHRG